MADASKISVFHKKPVDDLLQHLQDEINLQVDNKPWSSQKKEDIKRQFMLYKETVQEVINKNLTVNGLDWKNETIQTHAEPSSEITSEPASNGAGPLDKLKAEQLILSLQELDNSMRETACKRKTHPHSIRQQLEKKLCCDADYLASQQQQISNKSTRTEETCQEEPSWTNQDFRESLDRIQSSSQILVDLSEVIPEVHKQLQSLTQCIQTDLQNSEEKVKFFK